MHKVRGQFLILFALTAVVLLLIVGTALDAGRLYAYWSGLTRAIDAACSSAIRQVPNLPNDTAIQNFVTSVANFNLEQQGVTPAELASNFVINTIVTRRAEFAQLARLRITGNRTNVQSLLLRLIPGQEQSTVTANVACSTCYDNPTRFNIPVTGFFEGGMECQRICNERIPGDGNLTIPGTNTCCPFFHSYNPGDPASSCMCASEAAVGPSTNYCNPNDGAVVAINPGDLYPGGLTLGDPAVRIIRSDENDLQGACILSCGQAGSPDGEIWCNEACTDDGNDTVCCKCHCGVP